jgi:hypothetical protein
MRHLRQVLSLSILGIALYLNPLSTIALGDKAIAVESNSASTLKKIRSNHWTYQSVKSLSDRYRCTAKDQLLATLLQRNQPLTRFELAATLRSCIAQIGDRFVNSQDRRVLLALQREFNNEIVALKGDEGSFQAGSATLEAQQFSKDTKTVGEVVLGTPDWFQSLKELTERYEYTTGLNLPWQPKPTDNRYELAWELNSCLDQIMARFGSFKDKDQVIVDKLWAEFKPETQIIRNRIDDVLEVRAKELEARAAALEFKQFSPTSKLQGQTVITIQGGGF